MVDIQDTQKPKEKRARRWSPAWFIGGILLGAAISTAASPHMLGMAMFICLRSHPLQPSVGRRPPGATEAQDRQAIEAIERERTRTFNACDADAMVRLYVPGDTLIFHLIPPQTYDLRSFRNDFAELWRKFDHPAVMVLTNLSITTTSGDMAYAHALLRLTGRKRSGHVIDLEIRITDVLRNIDGQWLIEHEHWSVPVDPESGRAFLNSRQAPF